LYYTNERDEIALSQNTAIESGFIPEFFFDSDDDENDEDEVLMQDIPVEEIPSINIDELNKPVYKGHHSSLLVLLVALFSLVKKHGKGSIRMIKSILYYTLLCLPVDNDFPKSVGEIQKVLLTV
jgi:hypothetical protein